MKSRPERVWIRPLARASCVESVGTELSLCIIDARLAILF